MNIISLAERIFAVNFAFIRISDDSNTLFEYKTDKPANEQVELADDKLNINFGFAEKLNGKTDISLLAEYFKNQVFDSRVNCFDSIFECSNILYSILENESLDSVLKMIFEDLLNKGKFKSIGLMLFNEAVMTLKCVLFVTKNTKNDMQNNFRNFMINIDNKSILTDVLFFNKLEYIELENLNVPDIEKCFDDNILVGNIYSKRGPTGIVLAQPYWFDKNIEEQFKFYLRMVSIAIELSKTVKMYEFAIEDINYFKENIAKTNSLAQVGKFAATVAHEIKNPLVAIGGFASKLEKFINDNRGKAYLNIVNNEIERLDRIVSDILGYSNQNKLNFEEIELGKIFYDIIELISEKMKINNIDLDIKINNENEKIYVDEKRIKQVFLNIFENAIQSMDEGGKLSVTSYTLNEKVIIEVGDTGCGIPDNIVKKIFEPFFTTKEYGTGLGLAVSKEIITKHKGDIYISNKKKGTLVTVELPLRSEYEK